MHDNLAKIKRVSPAALLSGLKDDSQGNSIESARKLVAMAKDAGLGLRDFLRVKVDARLSENEDERRALHDLNGYEATLAYLGLPVKDDLDGGVMLRAANDTFQTFAGTRALFPEVIDDMVQWKYRQTNFESVAPMVSQIRTVAQPEMLTTVVNDAEADYQKPIRAIAERGRIPVYSIQSAEKTTKFYKFGHGYQVSYEFARRASIDLLTPYAARTQREIERAKVWAATTVLVNGDGVGGAAPVVAQGSYNGKTSANATTNKLSYEHLLAWLVDRASNGIPVDTVVGNWDLYLQWLRMFAIPSSDKTRTDAENLAAAGFQVRGVPILSGEVNFVLSSTAPANKLIGYSKADTLEMQVEAGSLIEESERSIQTQELTYVRSENSGFRLAFDDTRSILNLAA